MSKVFVNDNPQGPAKAPPAVQREDGAAGNGAAQVLIVLFGVAVMVGVCLLLYHYWKLAVAFILVAMLFAGGLSRAMTIGLMLVALVVLTIIGNAARAQTIMDGDAIGLNGTTWRLWGINAPESRQTCRDGWPADLEATHEPED
jgi:hypothetical protein